MSLGWETKATKQKYQQEEKYEKEKEKQGRGKQKLETRHSSIESLLRFTFHSRKLKFACILFCFIWLAVDTVRTEP